MRKALLLTAAVAIAIAAVAGDGLDLLSSARLRKARAEARQQSAVTAATTAAKGNGISTATTATSPAMIGAFVELAEGCTADDLRATGFSVLTVRGNIALCMVPVDSADVMARHRAVHTMSIARDLQPSIATAKAAIGLDKVHEGIGLPATYTGRGVVAGVVDQGIDPNHLNFRNPDGTTRLGYFYNIKLANTSTGYEHIGFFGDDVKNFTTDSKESYHGTHTLGILAGYHRGNVKMADASKFSDAKIPVPVTEQPNPYLGAAPGATLAAAGCSSLNDMFIAMGVDQICSYSYELQQPAVISLSLGSNVGPHDTNGILNRFLDLTATKADDNPMPPVLCVSAGNEGDRRIALKKRLKKGESFKTLLWPYLFQKTAESPETPTIYQDNFAIYSPDLTRLVVTPHLYNVDRGYREAGTFPQIGEGHGAYYITDEYFQMDESDQINDILAKWFHGFIGVGGMVDKDVNRYYAMVDIALQDSDLNFATTAGALTSSRYIPGFEIKIADDADVPEEGILIECYGSGQSTEMFDYKQSAFENGDYNGTISDMAVCPKLIVVGSYNTADEWFCLDGLKSRYVGEGDYFTPGRVSGFSSYGTLSDGRNLPTVCAPGSTIISSVNRYFTELDDVKDQAAQLFQACATDPEGRLNYWKQEVGTSMSCPLVAGAVACWLEADPTLTYADIQDIIAKTATVDDDVRAGDPVKWGAGKFDALAGIKEVLRRAALPSVSADSDSRLIITPAGDNRWTIFAAGENNLTASVYSMQGTLVKSASADADELTIDLADLTPGVYAISANNLTSKIIVK